MQFPLDRQVFRIDKAGSIDRLQLRTEPIAGPAPGEVMVKVKAIGLNFADVFALFGLYKATPKGSFVPGLEYAGEIMALGEGVDSVKVGDKVMGVTRFGAYATHLNIDARYIVPLPETWSFAEGAGFLVQVLTAYYALHPLGALKPGQTVLIHSAAGGVGIQANRIAKKSGAFTIGTVGSERKLALLEQEGYDAGLVRGKDFPQKLAKALAGRDLNLVLECIGGRILKQSLAALAPMGRLVAYGSAQYASTGARPNYLKLLWYYLQRPKFDIQNATNLNRAVLCFNLIFIYQQVEIMHELLDEIAALELPPPMIGHTFPFADLKEAIALFQTGQTMGKVVVEV
jgi:NADPH:quinone reductase-like Zn-dependent oxidoreductase